MLKHGKLLAGCEEVEREQGETLDEIPMPARSGGWGVDEEDGKAVPHGAGQQVALGQGRDRERRRAVSTLHRA